MVASLLKNNFENLNYPNSKQYLQVLKCLIEQLFNNSKTLSKMRIAILIFGFFLVNTTLFAQDDDYLLISLDTITGECGYVDTNGEYVIPTRKYPVCLTDTFRTFAVVL